MSNLVMSGAWLFKRKKEPEPLKEGEVIDIIQQAMENPSANTTVTCSGDEHRPRSKENQRHASSTVQKSESMTDCENEMDPKVVEYFKDFPQPYRDKAIQRFSKREGIYRYDFFRDYAMQHEWSSAVHRNVFLEDKREEKEKEDKLWNERLEKNLQEHIKMRRDGHIPEWEKKLIQYIPVDDDESAGWKLANVSTCCLLSGLLVYQGITFRKNYPKMERWKIYTAMALKFGGAGVVGTAAVYRLMNWGPFDRSVDHRSFITRSIDDCKKDWEKLQNFLDGKNK